MRSYDYGACYCYKASESERRTITNNDAMWRARASRSFDEGSTYDVESD